MPVTLVTGGHPPPGVPPREARRIAEEHHTSANSPAWLGGFPQLMTFLDACTPTLAGQVHWTADGERVPRPGAVAGLRPRPGCHPREVAARCAALNPGRVPGRLVLAVRLAPDRLPAELPALSEAAACTGTPVTWVCAPRPGADTATAEIGTFFDTHYSVGSLGRTAGHRRTAERAAFPARVPRARPRGRPRDPLPQERAFHYLDPRTAGRNVLTVPFRGGLRVDVQCRPDDDPDALGEAAAGWLPGLLPEGHACSVTWSSRYRFQQVVADRLTDAYGRVLLAGEAGHLFAPFGARGLNSGIADAAAATAALPTGDVSEYAHARHRAALLNRRAAGRALTHLTAPRPGTAPPSGRPPPLRPVRTARGAGWTPRRTARATPEFPGAATEEGPVEETLPPSALPLDQADRID
ncbi:FAD-dependent monooxygenase [Streptomyces rimosus]|uniref:FAD-dependent monooxygenase n=1 Tax=Streptomyces rimosus TaxID=1927 RepID=UPI00067C5117|nr:FAD-dependent monooxygenase [Streptomyces rimosus]